MDRPCTASPGFTLLEMLIAVAVTALLVTVTVQAYLGITAAQERAGAGLDRNRAADVFLDRFERELSAALLIVPAKDEQRRDHPYVFVGTANLAESGDADGVRFVTTNPARPAGALRGSGLRLVEYATESTLDFGIQLLRHEQPLAEGRWADPAGSDASVVLDEVASFGLSFQREDTGTWHEAWDSTDVAFLDDLPARVEVKLTLYEPTPEGDWVEGDEHERTVELPVRPIDIEALRSGRERADCLTVADCFGRYQSLLEGIDPEFLAELTAGLDMTACWSASGDAADALFDALGVDPQEECGP